MQTDLESHQALRTWNLLWGISLFGYYLVTMSRGLSLYDSGEIALAAEQLGLGHSLGQPLYTMIGFVLTKIFFVLPPLLVLNAYSALAGVIAYAIAVHIALLFLTEESRNAQSQWVAPTIAFIAALPTLWEPNSRIEVYALSAALGLAALWQCLRLKNKLSATIKRQWLFFGLFLGVCA
jgi:hypothetical protein